MKKKFDLTEMKRGKELSDIANKLENIDTQTKDVISDIEDNPNQLNINKGVFAINSDTQLSTQDKQLLLNKLRNSYITLFNFSNCPDDYRSLKTEAKFLSGISQYSFLIMAQRLLKIRDSKLYEEDNYGDFKSFIETELDIARSTAYCYIDVLVYFFDGGVHPGEHEIDYDLHYSKLFPVLPILKSDKDNIPKEEIKNKFLREVKQKTKREIAVKASELKLKYGLSVIKKQETPLEKMVLLVHKLNKNPSAEEQAQIQFIINQLNDYLETPK